MPKPNRLWPAVGGTPSGSGKPWLWLLQTRTSREWKKEFLPAAERNDLMRSIDRWVLHAALGVIARRKPDLLKATRKRRVAAGAGVQVQEVNRLLNQFEQMRDMMKKMKGGGMMKMMKRMGAMKRLGGPR